MPSANLSVEALAESARVFDAEMHALKERLGPPEFWHPHSNAASAIEALNIFAPEYRNAHTLAGDGEIAVIAGADGDLAFFLESVGLRASVVGDSATNYNRLEGARRIKEARASAVEIRDVDLDGTPYLTGWFGLAFLLDRLFHFKNPYGALERLARRARYCVLSTRVMRVVPGKAFSVTDYPLAYLLAPNESGDPTCTWVFTETALRRLVSRAGWHILDYVTTGNTFDSDPVSDGGDERAFLFLRSGVYN